MTPEQEIAFLKEELNRSKLREDIAWQHSDKIKNDQFFNDWPYMIECEQSRRDAHDEYKKIFNHRAKSMGKAYRFLDKSFLHPFKDVDEAIPWHNDFGASRDECFMATSTSHYEYGTGKGIRSYTSVPFTPFIDKIRTIVAPQHELCFANRYQTQHNHLGWHADDSESIDQTHAIYIVSFGAERYLWIRENGQKEIDKVWLPHGSVLVMEPGMQSTHEHRIPKHSAVCDARISLTFRKKKV